jgi:hypothetical protein
MSDGSSGMRCAAPVMSDALTTAYAALKVLQETSIGSN